MPRRNDEGSENQEGQVSFENYRDEGFHFLHVQQYLKAIESFTKALEMKPDDQQCLVMRSKCHLQVGNAEGSLTDAETALEENPQHVKGLFQKAEALYQKGDFETALVYYHRGNKLRPELQEFRLGIQKSSEAINNSIGTPDSVKLDANKGDMSYFYKQEESFDTVQKKQPTDDEGKVWVSLAQAKEQAKEKAKAKEAKKQQRGGYQKPTTKKEEKKDRDAPKPVGNKQTIQQLLGELYGDKDFLEKLLNDQSLTGKTRNDNSREIKDKVCDGLEYLYARADFWRQQKPMYARKRDKERQERRRQSNKARGSMEKVLKNLEEIDEAQTEGKYQQGLEKAKQTLKLVENASDDDIQNKPELLASLHSSIGNCLLELGKLNQSLDHHEQDLYIAREYSLEDAKSRALDNLGRVYARKGDFEKAIEVWEEKIPASKSALESTWLYHEIGRCYLELGKYSDARDFGEKSLAAAREADDKGWQLHATVLVAQAEVKMGDYQSAADSFERSLEMAQDQNDSAAEQAISKALEEVNQKIVRGVQEGDEDEAGTEKYEDDFETDRDMQTLSPPTEAPKPPSLDKSQKDSPEKPTPKSPSPQKTPPKTPPKSPEPPAEVKPSPERRRSPERKRSPELEEDKDDGEQEQQKQEKADKPDEQEEQQQQQEVPEDSGTSPEANVEVEQQQETIETETTQEKDKDKDKENRGRGQERRRSRSRSRSRSPKGQQKEEGQVAT